MGLCFGPGGVSTKPEGVKTGPTSCMPWWWVCRGPRQFRRDGERSRPEITVWKAAIIKRDGQCSICGSKDNGLIAHHVLGFTMYPMLQTNMMNGYTVCPECHKAIHRGDVSEEILEELTMLKINLLNSLLK